MPARLPKRLPAKPNRRRWWLVLGLVLVVAATGLGSVGWICNALAYRNLTQRRLVAADGWARWGAMLSGLGGVDWPLRLSLERKLGRIPEFERASVAAMAAGVMPELIQAEQMLIVAQSGELEQPEAVLSQLIQADLVSGREIFEAFTNGASANYRMDDALYLIENWQQDYPTDPLPHMLRGRIAEHQSNWTLASEQYLAALQLAPSFGPASYNLARVKLGQSQLNEAEVNYQQAARTLELPQPAWAGLAHCERLKGRLVESERLLERVLAADTETRSLAYRLVGDTADSGKTSPLVERGELRLAQERPEEAVADFEAALREQPRNTAIRFHLANALRKAGRAEESRREYDAVRAAREELSHLTAVLEQVHRQPDDPEPRTRLGKMFLSYISERQGLVWLQSALHLDPQYQPAHAALARYYRSLEPATEESQRLAERHAAAAGAALDDEAVKSPARPVTESDPE